MAPPTEFPWAHSHAALPTVGPISGDRAQLLFGSRDERNRMRIGRAHLDVERMEVISVDPEPILGLGAPGCFDDNGVTPSCLILDGERLLLYYSGWNLGTTVPFHLAIGLAISDDGGASFQRIDSGPIIDRRVGDPVLSASPWVRRGSDGWRMWYVSGVRWEPLEEGQMRHHYNVRTARSGDGIAWQSDPRPAIDFAGPGEYAIARPCVLRRAGVEAMWFCARGDDYRLGFASRERGDAWRRDDKAVRLERSGESFDRGMVAYPCVFQAGGRLRMLYNAEGYGATGIGHAVLDK